VPEEPPDCALTFVVPPEPAPPLPPPVFAGVEQARPRTARAKTKDRFMIRLLSWLQ
jgi:hypothetical protein